MDPVSRCEDLVARLRAQVDMVLPAGRAGTADPYGYAPERLPPERLPTVSGLVLDVLSAEAALLEIKKRTLALQMAAGRAARED